MEEPKNKYDYGPMDKPKGQATVVPDEPLAVFPSENEQDNPDNIGTDGTVAS